VTIRTTYLGQYTWEDANRIAGRLTAADIVWWEKQSGAIMRVLSSADWGVRLFVDEARVADARAIAESVVGDGRAGP